jgi:hypothetical protein
MDEINLSDEKIEQVSRVLSEWNPLGDNATIIADLDGYRTEAADILFALYLSESKPNIARMIRDVMNEAFDLSLSVDECRDVGGKISAILNMK